MMHFFKTVLGGLLKLVIIAGVLYFFLILYFTQQRPQTMNELKDMVVKSFSSDENLKKLKSQMQDSLQKIESQDEFTQNAVPAVQAPVTTEKMQSSLIRLQTEVDELKDRVEALEKHNRALEAQIKHN